MKEEAIENLLRKELKKVGDRWTNVFKTMSHQERLNYFTKLVVRRLISEEIQKMQSKCGIADEVPYLGDPEIMETNTTLGNSSGGGKRVVRETKTH